MVPSTARAANGPGTLTPVTDLLTLIRGFLMGSADVVPGVSGGTVALVLGIYERVVRNIRTGAGALGSLVRGRWEIESWAALNDRWREKLQLLAAEFLAGNASVDPQHGACTWCGLEALCRVDREVAT